jgi:hypothetical protein
MNKRASLILIALLAAVPAWARIIVDDSAPEPAAQGIHVPAPSDSGAPAKGPQQDTLSFLNKDQLHGILIGIDDAGLHWQSPEAHDPIVFKTGQVSDIKLDSHVQPQVAKSAQRIGLTNGDELPGNIVSLDDKTLILDTWYASRISIPREMLRSITPLSDSDAALYEGPTGMDGWTVSRMGGGRVWSFRDGALVGTSYGTIGRDVKLPPVSDVAFDVILRGNCQFSVGIYSERADNFTNCYMMTLANGFTELQRLSANGGSNSLGSTQLQNVIRHDVSHIELRTDKEKKSIWLLVDGKVAKQWTDPADFNGGGGSLLFSCQPGTYVRISNIKVSKWDGKFDNSTTTGDKSTQDMVQLANDDKVSGSLESIKDGVAKFSSSYAELSIPIARVSEIDLSASHASVAKDTPTDVRAYFPEGGAVTMQLSQWDSKGALGVSPNFGRATFSPNAFARLLFNLPAQQQTTTDDTSVDSDNQDQGGDQ